MVMTLAEAMARRAVGALEKLPTDAEAEQAGDETIRQFVVRARQILGDVHLLHPGGEDDLPRVANEVTWFASALHTGTRLALSRMSQGFDEGEPNAAQCGGQRADCLDPSFQAGSDALRYPVLCDIDYIGCMGARLKSRSFASSK